jgi:hypothetical protein
MITSTKGINEMKNLSAKQLKDAMINLYNKNDDISCKAYRIAFDLLEAEVGEEKMDQFLDAHGM